MIGNDLGAQALATGSTTATDDVATANSCHAGAKAMAALADELGWLVSALHVKLRISKGLRINL